VWVRGGSGKDFSNSCGCGAGLNYAGAGRERTENFNPHRTIIYIHRIKFRMLEVHENDIALRKFTGGTAQLRSCAQHIKRQLSGNFSNRRPPAHGIFVDRCAMYSNFTSNAKR